MIAFIIQSPDDVSSSISGWTVLISNYFDKRKRQREQLKIAEERKAQSKGLSPDELASAHPSNFAVRFEDIALIEITHRLFDYRLIIHLSKPVAMRTTVEFFLKKEQVILAQDLFKKILPAKLKE